MLVAGRMLAARECVEPDCRSSIVSNQHGLELAGPYGFEEVGKSSGDPARILFRPSYEFLRRERTDPSEGFGQPRRQFSVL